MTEKDKKLSSLKKELNIEKDLRLLAYKCYEVLDKASKDFSRAKHIVFDELRNLADCLFMMRKNWVNFENWGNEFLRHLNLFNFHIRLIFDSSRNGAISGSGMSEITELSGSLGGQIVGWIKSGIKSDQKL